MIYIRSYEDVLAKMTQEDVTYVITRSIDLHNSVLTVPDGAIIKFKWEGAIKNGSIEFKNNTIVRPRFMSMNSYTGMIRNEEIAAVDYPCKNDEILLRFLFDMAANGSVVTLERNHSYIINCGNYHTWKKWDDFTLCSHAFVSYTGLKRFCIIGNQATIRFINEPSQRYIYILYFRNCSNVSITDLNLKGSVDYYAEPKSYAVEFIKSQFEADHYQIDLQAENIAIPFSYGDYYQTLSDIGIRDSWIRVSGNNNRYNMRIHGGRDCRFESLFENVHRGMYLAGIDDCEIRATGKNAWTGVGAMITCAKMNGSLRGASNIIATIVDTGTIRNNNSEPLPVHLEITSAGDKVDGGLFRRSDHLEFLNIDVDYLASVFTNSMVICPVRFTGSDFVDKDGRDNVPEDIVQVECKMRVCRMNSNMWNAQAGINQVIYILQYWHRNVISDYSIELSSDDNVMSFVGYIAPHKNQKTVVSCPRNKLQVYPFPNSDSDIFHNIDSTAILILDNCPKVTIDADPIKKSHGTYNRILIRGNTQYNNRGNYQIQKDLGL